MFHHAPTSERLAFVDPMKRLRHSSFGLCLAIMLVACPLMDADARTYAAIVIDYQSGEVLHEENADARIYPASLTKMMTLFLTFQALDRGELSLRQRLPVSAHAAAQPPSKLGLKPGSSIRVEHAILALATKSANDVAVVVAEALGGSEAGFARMMNRTARSLGMRSTNFANASGLPNDRQTSTARDLAKLSRAMISDWPAFYPYFSRGRFRYGNRVYRGHNRLMERYDGMDGIKTGYIRASGFNLAASAVRGNRRLITVVIGGKTARQRDDRVEVLMNEAFGRLGLGPTVVAGTRSHPDVTPPPSVLPPPNPLRLAAAATRAAEPRRGADALAVLPSTKPVLVADTGSMGDADEFPIAIPEPKPLFIGWGVQVGAFSDKQRTERALSTAGSVLSANYQRLAQRMEPVAVRRGTVWRARFYGFGGEQAASTACSLVRRNGQRCTTVAP